MIQFKRNTTLVILSFAAALKCAHSLLAESLYQAYLEQGIHFRENVFLGDEPILEEYDFVVIGAGPGGAVVANRLSEINHWKILLLEAGEDENIYTDIPVIAAHWSTSSFNWGYRAERTENACLALVDQRCRLPRGKGLGGSSIINYMMYTRGHRQDYDDYAAKGNTGWSYDEILPYYLKSENNSIPEYKNSPYHSQNGYLSVERPRHKTILVDAFLEGGKELGYEIIDYNEPTQHGFSRLQSTTRKGRRCSAAKAYLKSVKHRSNLHVSILSRVTKILIDPRMKNAYGVEFVKNQRKRVVFARKEVILSAGALNSPQLLMLSGVGPKEHLKQLNIPVIQDLKVGENLDDHYISFGVSFLINQTGVSLLESRLNLKIFLDWLNNGRNIMTMPGGVEGIGYTRTKYATESDQRPDMEFIFIPGSVSSDNGDLKKSFGLSDYYYDQIFKPTHNADTLSIYTMLVHPRTKGKILLRDKNPWNAPRFYYNYFEDEHDLKVMVEGVKEVIKLSKTRAFQRLGTRLNPARLLQCSQHTYNSDEYWGCFVRYFTSSLYHQCCTCKMGPSTDKSAVVDPELKVYGINNLRVVDTSIFPDVPGAHTYAPTLMVGEKASDMIKKRWL